MLKVLKIERQKFCTLKLKMEREKLNNYNYATWKDDVLTLLMDKWAYKHVINKDFKLKEEATATETHDIEIKKNQVYSTIHLNISKDLKPLIHDTKVASKAWKRDNWTCSKK